jgi:[ribosomal protein S18]-alanine N-acetyltransferase
MKVVRPARGADLEALCELERLCFGQEAWSRVLVQDELDAENRLVFAVEAGAGDAAVVAGYASTSLAGASADVLRIAVHPDFQRAGLGSALLTATLDALPGTGCEEVLLEVHAGNKPALRLYEAFGFAQISVRRGYYDNGQADALLLRLDLLGGRRSSG